MSKGTTSQDAPFGTLLGYAPGGVAIYSSDYSSLDPRDYDDDAAFRSYIDDEYMGHKWQCVEFARRFLFLNYGVVFTDVGMAWEIFSLRFLREVVNDNILPLQAFPNGSPRAPVAGALLIWQKGGEFKDTGHVAVVTQLLETKSVLPNRTCSIRRCLPDSSGPANWKWWLKTVVTPCVIPLTTPPSLVG